MKVRRQRRQTLESNIGKLCHVLFLVVPMQVTKLIAQVFFTQTKSWFTLSKSIIYTFSPTYRYEQIYCQGIFLFRI